MSGILTPAYMIRGKKTRLVYSQGKKPQMTKVGVFNPSLYDPG